MQTLVLRLAAAIVVTTQSLSVAAASPLDLNQVNTDISAHVGARIAWGGTIVSVQHEAHGSWIELSERALDAGGRPLISSPSKGRFVVRTNQLQQPEEYRIGLPLTVTGILRGSIETRAPSGTTTLALVRARKLSLWKVQTRPSRRRVAYTPSRQPHRPYRDGYYDPAAYLLPLVLLGTLVFLAVDSHHGHVGFSYHHGYYY